MSRRIDIELTSALPDDSWTWRAAGAKQPKGTLDGSILSPGAAVGDVVKVEVDQEIDGITVLSVVGDREKQDREGMLDLLPTEREFKPVIETRAKRDRNDRGRSDGGSRRGRDDRGRGRRDRDDRGDREGRSDRGRGKGGPGGSDDRSGRGRRGGPSFTPPPEVPQRPKPKRLKPSKRNRNAVLAELPEEQRPIAEVALQGMGAVRQRLREENDKAAAEGRSPMPEASVLKMAEDMLPKLRVAEWRDRAEAAQRQMDQLDLRDLRSVVAASGDPAVARDETTAALAAELTQALATKQEQELRLWFGDVDAALAVGRVIRALRLSSQPPKAGVPFPADIAQRLVDSTNASLAPMDSAERWIAMLEAAAFSPVRTSVAPVRKPDVITDELLATVKRLAPALPQVAALFEIEVDPKASMPKPLRAGPRNRKGGKDGKDGDRKPSSRKGGKDSKDSDRGASNRKGGQKGAGKGDAPTRGRGGRDGGRTDTTSGGSTSPATGAAAADNPTTTDATATESTATDVTATEDTATESTATDVTATEDTATEDTATESTATDRTPVTDDAADTTATESTATESTATEDTATEDTATDVTAADDTATESTATDATATDGPPVTDDATSSTATASTSETDDAPESKIPSAENGDAIDTSADVSMSTEESAPAAQAPDTDNAPTAPDAPDEPAPAAQAPPPEPPGQDEAIAPGHEAPTESDQG